MFRPEQMGVYIHWPFCKARCPYCDFNTYIRQHDFDEEIWLDAYLKSLDSYAQLLPNKEVVSIFFGGGTPSLMSVQAVGQVIDYVCKHWRVVDDVEVTLEANPTSIENAKLQGFAKAGVNRLSLGVQSLNDKGLKLLGRQHNVDEALRALDLAERYFSQYNFDLIYARPDQSLTEWEDELKYAVSLGAAHMSLYQLTIAGQTPFYKRMKRGELVVTGEIEGAQFYRLTQDIMDAAGLPAYEVSNHARIGQECQHNLVYWHMADYIGIGAGAHGRYMLDGEKYATCDKKKPEHWLEYVRNQGMGFDIKHVEKLSKQDRFYEALLMGFRLSKGVS
ncbi:MAG: coproporphyrinogen III oxidase, partial [Alphaproteobacteria bacterium]|nr:coproporphyrinogen III oxidase [Alphaproteobacteria bacterium]